MRAALALAMTLSGGCAAPDATGETDDGTAGASTGSTSSSSRTSTGSGSTDASGAGIVAQPDGGSLGCNGCDPFEIDACDPGHKCVPVPCGPGLGSGTRCVPVMGDGKPFDPCERLSAPEQGLDDCGPFLACARVGADDDDLACMRPCTGQPSVCGTGTTCVTTANQGPYWCWRDCDPFANDCPANLSMCTGAPDHVLTAVCQAPTEASAGQAEVCVQSWNCAPGLTCVWSFVMPENDCTDAECCTAMCDLDAPDCPMFLTCRSFFALREPVLGLEHLGYCVE